MSGNYGDWSATAADTAAAAAEVAPAKAAQAQYQAQAARFMAEHGAAVNNGHADVGATPPALVGE